MAVVSVDEMKPYLKVEHDEEDGILEGLIVQAQAAAEDYCRVQFDEGSCPAPVRLAIMLMVSHYFENRDNSDRFMYSTMLNSFKNLLYPYRDADKMF